MCHVLLYPIPVYPISSPALLSSLSPCHTNNVQEPAHHARPHKVSLGPMALIFFSCCSIVHPLPICLIQYPSFPLLSLYLRIYFTHSPCCPHHTPFFLSSLFFALLLKPNPMRMLTGISTRAAQSLFGPHPRILLTLELSTMALANWVPSVAESVSLWIGRLYRSALRTVSI